MFVLMCTCWERKYVVLSHGRYGKDGVVGFVLICVGSHMLAVFVLGVG